MGDISDCDPQTLVWAENECARMTHGEKVACIFDACAEDRGEALKIGTSAARAALTRPELVHDCQHGEPAAWDSPKEAWCCQTQHKCKPVPGVAPEPCDSMCVWAGQSKSCNARIIWSATQEDIGKPTACALAHEKVLRECPICMGCELAKTTCRQLWTHKSYFRRYSVTAATPAPHEVPASKSIDPRLLAALLLSGFTVVAVSGMAMRHAIGGRFRKLHGYSSARFLMTSREEEDEAASGTLLTLSANWHGGAE